MADDTADFQRPVRASSWADSSSRESLQVIVEGVSEATGFEVVGISVIREDGYLQVLVLVGPEEARTALIDTLAPAQMLLDQLETADDWGVLAFIPHDRLELDIDTWGWFSDAPRVEQAGHWHPEDMLVAPLEDAHGRLIGILGLELPRDGLLPDGERRAAMEISVARACRMAVLAIERERLAEQVRLAQAAADIVRRVSTTMSAAEILAACGPAVVEGFRADSAWVQLLDASGDADGPLRHSDGRVVDLPPGLLQLAAREGRHAWERQRVLVFAPDRVRPGLLSQGEIEEVSAHLAGLGAESMMFVPVGAGTECFGMFGLGRAADAAEWSTVEAHAALEIGRDLGRVLANARNLDREHRLVEELRQVADLKGQLVATVSHEIKNPLSSIVGYAEMLEAEPNLSDRARGWLAAVQRGGARLQRVVDDLLMLHRIDGEVDGADLVTLDLAPILTEAVGLSADIALGRGLDLRVDLADGVPLVRGDAHQLDRVVTNLVSNAVKYTPTGSVTVSLRAAGDEVVIAVCDTGLGISAADRTRLFSEFHRGSNPLALAQPGTGLGLAIVQRIVDRHRGRIEVESEPGRGSTFRVHLPAAGPKLTSGSRPA